MQHFAWCIQHIHHGLLSYTSHPSTPTHHCGCHTCKCQPCICCMPMTASHTGQMNSTQMKRLLTLFNLAPQFLISGTRGWCVEGAWHFKQIAITSELKTMQRKTKTKTNNNHLPKQRATVDNWMTMLLASMQIGPKISTVNRINIRLIRICIYRTQSTTIILYYHFKYFTVWFKWNLNWVMTNISITRYWVILPAYKFKDSKLLGNWISLPIVTQVKPHSEIVVVNNTISQQILLNGFVSCHAHISFRLICNYLYLLCDWVLLWKSSCFVVVVCHVQECIADIAAFAAQNDRFQHPLTSTSHTQRSLICNAQQMFGKILYDYTGETHNFTYSNNTR